MESQRINILLEKYFEAETTLNEENELINYFNSEKVDESLKQYIPLFEGLKELSTSEYPGLGDDLMNHILESEHKDKLMYRWRWMIVTAVAASVILAMLAVNMYSRQKQWKDTYSNPEQAYVAASNTLDYVAGLYNKGLAQLKPIGKIENATAPLTSGMKTLEKGLNKLDIMNYKL